jgi:hypothetical protein
MRAALLIPAAIVTSMMVAGWVIVVNFENQVPVTIQEVISVHPAHLIDVSTGGDLVLSFGAFLLAVLVADVAITLPLLLLARRSS